jgi:hypothetical protein
MFILQIKCALKSTVTAYLFLICNRYPGDSSSCPDQHFYSKRKAVGDMNMNEEILVREDGSVR